MARQNDHTRTEELISAYLDKRTSAEEQVFFERHIASCADCRAQLEATRSMVAALKAMPAVRAPRSFVLPREMARQPRRSFLPLYPALRLATVIAAMAFVVLFAGDLLINQSVGRSASQFIPAAAPAPAVQAPAAPAAQRAAAPTTAPQPTTAPAAQPTQAPAPQANADNTATATSAASAAAMAGAAAQAPISATATTTEVTALSATAATPEAPATATAVPQSKLAFAPTPGSTRSAFDQRAASAAEQSAAANTTPSAPTIAPLHVVEIALLALVIVLGIATLIVRRKVRRN